MLQAAKKNKFKATAIIVCLLCVLSLCVAVGAAFINTNRDTRPVPDVAKSSLKYSNAKCSEWITKERSNPIWKVPVLSDL